MRIFESLNVDFLGKRKFFYVVSAVMLIAGVGSLVVRGLELGIDFLGGSEIVLQFEKPIDIADVRQKVGDIGLGEMEVKTFGDETGALIRTELQQIPEDLYPKVRGKIEETMSAGFPDVGFEAVDTAENSITYALDNPDTVDYVVDELFESGFQASVAVGKDDVPRVMVRVGIADWIKEQLREKMGDNDFDVLREDKVGPKIGEELKWDAVTAIVASLVIILIYLGFRFKFIFAMGAVAALFHDVLVTLGLFSILWGWAPFVNLEIDLTVVAAFLTLVGYSINDTVIVFDRVRENLKIHKTEPLEKLMNRSINMTMSRTILTGGTTMLAVFVLFMLGGEVLRAFSFTLFFGIIIGTYSSIFVASALVLDYAEKRGSKVEF
jgi:preprotein translocase SecF subunit